MSLSVHSLRLASIAVLAGSAFAQVTPETEPNETKAQATANGIVTMVAGDKLTGTTTGNSLVMPGAPSADTWHVKTGTLAAGIYRHTLTLTTTGMAGHTATLRGLAQVAGVIDVGSDVAFATSSSVTPIPRSVAWYGFGRGEEMYYRVGGIATTTMPYEVTLTTVPVAPIVVPGTFASGSLIFSTVGQTTTDTDIHLFDSTLTVIDDASNDDESIAEGGTGASLQSRLTRTLTAGTYYLAVGRYNTATNDDSPSTDDFATGSVLDLPNAIASSSTTTAAGGTDFDIVITDSAGPVGLSVLGNPNEPFSIVFVQFTVDTAIPTPVAYCFGDGSGTACPCGNAGAAGNGCANSVEANGANLTSSGTASIGSDTLALLGSGMPNSSSLYFQGTTQIASVFGDGIHCVGGVIRRLGTQSNAAGASQYPSGADPLISVRGLCAAGDARNYQCWYRNKAAFCTASTFNLTNGLQVTWSP